MRRQGALILIGLGAFFLTLAPLVRFYVADQVVVAPLNRYQVSHLEAKNATYFDAAKLQHRKGATLRAINTVRGDVRANNGDNDIAVWDSSTNIYDQAHPDKPIQIQGYRAAFDRRSSVLKNCCGSNVDGDSTVKMTGYGLLFPLANVDKRDYPFFDMTTKQPAPMRFNGVEKVQGLETYRFVQEIPNTKTAALDTKVPGNLLGLGKKSKDQKVDRYTAAVITVWVDPRTGVPVKHRQSIDSSVMTADGKGKMTVAQADLVMIEEDQKKLAALSNDNAFKISAVRSYVPIGAVLVGLILLLLGGIAALVGGAKRRAAAPNAPRRADGKFGDVAPAPQPDAPRPGTPAAPAAKPVAGQPPKGRAAPRRVGKR